MAASSSYARGVKRQRTPSNGKGRIQYRRPSTTVRVVRVGEKKGMDTPLDTSVISSTLTNNANTQVLNLIQQGAGSWNRVGRKVKLSSIRVRGAVQWKLEIDGAADASGNLLRMALVWDKQPSGNAIPAFDDIFKMTEEDGDETQTSLFSSLRYDNMDRFTVLRDQIMEFNADVWPSTDPVAGTPTNFKICPFDVYVKLGGRECVYSGQTSPMSIADISTGALYLVVKSLSSATTTELNFRQGSVARLRYLD